MRFAQLLRRLFVPLLASYSTLAVEDLEVLAGTVHYGTVLLDEDTGEKRVFELLRRDVHDPAAAVEAFCAGPRRSACIDTITADLTFEDLSRRANVPPPPSQQEFTVDQDGGETFRRTEEAGTASDLHDAQVRCEWRRRCHVCICLCACAWLCSVHVCSA